ncbi:MAG: class I SAM-dependent methyltransferase [Candidatus Electrothrix sp. AR5]|nr:class I SAM-dependent methyltransferase [Candidatus Electrothrix sp. AR5]
MRKKTDWDKRYEENDLPWDSGKPDIALTNLVAQWPVCTGKVLDIGCGTGTNAIWLAQQGFEVTGLDISDKAIALAKKNAPSTGYSASC